MAVVKWHFDFVYLQYMYRASLRNVNCKAWLQAPSLSTSVNSSGAPADSGLDWGLEEEDRVQPRDLVSAAWQIQARVAEGDYRENQGPAPNAYMVRC